MTAKKGSRSTPKTPAPPPRVGPSTGPAKQINDAMRKPLVPGRRPFKMPHEAK